MNNLVQIPDEVIIHKIYLIRDRKVMIDRDLAELFGVETKRLKEAVRRNLNRFPADFMFEMNARELEHWRKEHLSEEEDKFGLRYAPYCFTEPGVTMLACILNSDIAVEMNIRIIRVFTGMREMMMGNKDVLLKMELLEKQVVDNSMDIRNIFQVLKELITPPTAPVRKIGYKQH